MKTITHCLSAIILTVVLHFSAKAQFAPITNCGATNGTGHAIFFVNADTGYVAGENSGKGIIQKTTNGGQTWSNVYTSVKNYAWVVDITFFNSTTGFALVKDSITGYVLKTIDGGNTWTSQLLSNYPGKGICFPSGTTGYIAGGVNGKEINGQGTGVIYKTINGGTTWNQQTAPTTSFLDDVFFTDPLVGYVCGDYDILKTIDGGNSWTKVSFTGNNGERLCIYCTDANTCYIGGTSVLKTTNGGSTWNVLSLPHLSPSTFYYAESLYFTDSQTGYAAGAIYDTIAKVGKGVILKTVNAGQTWTDITTNVPADTAEMRKGDLASIQFVNPQLGYTVGNRGITLKTINAGGTTGIEPLTNITGITIYPNPVSTTLNFNFDKSFNGAALFYDMLGRIVKTVKLEGQSSQISVSDLPSALYYLQVITPEGAVYSGKICKTE